MVTVGVAGASHGLIAHLDKLAFRPGHRLIYSVADVEQRDPTDARAGVGAAIGQRRQPRERRADNAWGNLRCGPARWWVQEAHVTELTGLLRDGPGTDQLASWSTMWVFVRRERPHQGQLSLFETQNGWRYALWITN
jgi:hypothetical protein